MTGSTVDRPNFVTKILASFISEPSSFVLSIFYFTLIFFFVVLARQSFPLRGLVSVIDPDPPLTRSNILVLRWRDSENKEQTNNATSSLLRTFINYTYFRSGFYNLSSSKFVATIFVSNFYCVCAASPYWKWGLDWFFFFNALCTVAWFDVSMYRWTSDESSYPPYYYPNIPSSKKRKKTTTRTELWNARESFRVHKNITLS